ncbi:FtsX-like permease family protein [Gordonia amarae]|uniref:FtsX-like permease family protein n=1 Tax=Gordonia amarae TaxID=36821 RepID=A0A857MJT6_9ACTN|nr:FtsX-like permease family protein [Gordonia amarae]QHN24240.1 FtsX-like permease family protein [Gordonia amarae]QHN33159.1 FtsX-like permease family protein [Gordonia amarae]QHN41882.1 FtsX-like permease family protein [Gordonia amarae]
MTKGSLSATSPKLTVGSLRELTTVGVVCGIGAAYSAALLGASDLLDTVSRAEGDDPIGQALSAVSSVFILVALFVSAIVISNGVDTVIAGRRDQLTLLRLIGASGRQLRSGLVRAVAAVAATGAVIGVAVGTAGVDVTRIILVHNGKIPDADYSTITFLVVPAAVAVVGTAVVATLAGTRRTLASVAAIQTVRREVPRWRLVAAAGVVATGAVILGIACRLGENGSTAGFFAAFFGSALVSAGFLIGAPLIVPRLVSACGRAVGTSPSALLARKNAVSDPARTTRSAVGLLIGVTLVTSIAAGMTSLHTAVRHNWADLTPEQVATNDKILDITTTVLVAIIAISVIIAAVGFISTMSLTVISRTREIGMLRAMGFTARQVRSMIFRESLALTGTAVAGGLTLGIVFGSIASQSLIGHLTSGMPIGLPWGVLVAIIAGTFVLAVVAALPPSRRAVAVSPVDALATP